MTYTSPVSAAAQGRCRRGMQRTYLLGRLNGYRILLRDGDDGRFGRVVLLALDRASELRIMISTRAGWCMSMQRILPPS
jgi:hypothetical protein